MRRNRKQETTRRRAIGDGQLRRVTNQEEESTLKCKHACIMSASSVAGEMQVKLATTTAC